MLKPSHGWSRLSWKSAWILTWYWRCSISFVISPIRVGPSTLNNIWACENVWCISVLGVQMRALRREKSQEYTDRTLASRMKAIEGAMAAGNVPSDAVWHMFCPFGACSLFEDARAAILHRSNAIGCTNIPDVCWNIALKDLYSEHA